MGGNDNPLEVLSYNTAPKFFYRLRVGAVRAGFDQNALDANDDGSTPDAVPFGFNINLFGMNLTGCYINNNGNITFGSGLYTYTPNPLQRLGIAMIAPFWADVDTRAAGSNVVRFSDGVDTVDGHAAFAVNWGSVGYYAKHTDKLNDFQLVMIERADTGAGNFDVEFNYNHVFWETGDASGGYLGYGGAASRSGITNGLNRTIELAFSGRASVQLDANPSNHLPNYTTGLIYRSRNCTIPGRFVFHVRDGNVTGALEVSAGPDQRLASGVTTTTLAGSASDPGGGAVTVHWSVLSGTTKVVFSDPDILDPTVTLPNGESVTLQLTATSTVDPTVTAAASMRIN